MSEITGSGRGDLKDTPRFKNDNAKYKWECSKCEASNNTNTRSCTKCRSMRTQAKTWKCGKCNKMMTNGVASCPECFLDINGFSTNW